MFLILNITSLKSSTMLHIWSVLILQIHTIHCQNTWEKDTGPNGEDIWRSTSNFKPVDATSFGTIKIGQFMTVEFDFIFHGRTHSPQIGEPENFFRIGHSAFNASNTACETYGSAYPSMWLSRGLTNSGKLDISSTSGAECPASYQVSTTNLNVDITYHITISLNNTAIMIQITGGNEADYTQTWSRNPTLKQYLGIEVPIWFSSDRLKGSQYSYNVGDGTFSNIIIQSQIFTIAPSITPTTAPTTSSITPSYAPTTITIQPTLTPTVQPSITPTHTPTETGDTYSPSSAPTHSPSHHPSLYPTDHPSMMPSSSPNTVSPTAYPTHAPSIDPTVLSIHPTYTSQPPTSIPTKTPSAFPSTFPSKSPSVFPSTDYPTYPIWWPYTTTPVLQQQSETVVAPIDSNENDDDEDGDPFNQYEYVEITIFSTVIALCFCTVFCFLLYLTFKRRLNTIQKTKSLEKNAAPHQMDMLYSNSNPSKSKSPKHESRSFRETEPPVIADFAHISSKSQTNTSKHTYLKSPHSGRDRIKYHYQHQPSLTPSKNSKDTTQSDHRHPRNGMDVVDIEAYGYGVQMTAKKKKKRRKTTLEYEPRKYSVENDGDGLEYAFEDEYEVVLDGYVDGIYTPASPHLEGPRDTTDHVPRLRLSPHRYMRRGHAAVDQGNRYDWIRQTLQRVDSQNHDRYLNNFERHRVEDDRLGDLLPDDWKELIPAIGPRNDFKRLWKMRDKTKQSNHAKGYGEDEHDAETETLKSTEYTEDTDDIPQELHNELLDVLSEDEAVTREEDVEVKRMRVEVEPAPFIEDDLDEAQAEFIDQTPTTMFDDEEDSSEEDDEYYEEEEEEEEAVTRRKPMDDTPQTQDSSVLSPSKSFTGSDAQLTFSDLRKKYAAPVKSKAKSATHEKKSVLSALSSAPSLGNTNSTRSDDSRYYNESEDSRTTQSSTDELEREIENRRKRKSNKYKQNRLNVKQKMPPPIEEVDADDDSSISSSPTPTHEVLKEMKTLVSPAIGQAQYYHHTHNIITHKNASQTSNDSAVSGSSHLSIQSAASEASTSFGAPPEPEEADPNELKQPLRIIDDDDETDEETVGIPRFEADVESSDDNDVDHGYHRKHHNDSDTEDDEYQSGDTEEQYEEQYEDEYDEEDQYEDDQITVSQGLTESEPYTDED
eukprot:390767_1